MGKKETNQLISKNNIKIQRLENGYAIWYEADGNSWQKGVTYQPEVAETKEKLIEILVRKIDDMTKPSEIENIEE